ncbi:hypothetical protein GWI33_021139 [Rhynchophorus ferrugineus]|uniref:Uncharacterized protein n=1 Tax=Rhynchophorus ferrugineus TaxID=354439 RepID=A0A834M3K3_RHYFE|nr:hypothetical protein GWI33_021139 [Rhynchophorus ferrugineus]
MHHVREHEFIHPQASSERKKHHTRVARASRIRDTRTRTTSTTSRHGNVAPFEKRASEKKKPTTKKSPGPSWKLFSWRVSEKSASVAAALHRLVVVVLARNDPVESATSRKSDRHGNNATPQVF